MLKLIYVMKNIGRDFFVKKEKIFQIQILVTFAATRADDEKFTLMEFFGLKRLQNNLATDKKTIIEL